MNLSNDDTRKLLEEQSAREIQLNRAEAARKNVIRRESVLGVIESVICLSPRMQVGALMDIRQCDIIDIATGYEFTSDDKQIVANAIRAALRSTRPLSTGA